MIQKNKGLIIVDNRHQYQKALKIRYKFSSEINIYSSYKTKEPNEIRYGDKKQDIPLNDDVSFIILFTAHATKRNLNLINKANNLNKSIFLIQETLQFFTHHGDVNNIVLPVDYIITSSNFDKEFIIKEKIINEKNIFHQGWIFHEIKTLEHIKNKKILLILGASNQINPFSLESFASLQNLLFELSLKFKAFEIFIKSHPQDKKFQQLCLKQSICKMSFIENDKDLNQEITKYEVIVASEKSQALLDLINNHKNLYSYSINNNTDNLVEVKKVSEGFMDKYTSEICNDNNAFERLENFIIKNASRPKNKFALLKKWEAALKLSRTNSTSKKFLEQTEVNDHESSNKIVKTLIFLNNSNFKKDTDYLNKIIEEDIINEGFANNFPYHSLIFFMATELNKISLNKNLISIYSDLKIYLRSKNLLFRIIASQPFNGFKYPQFLIKLFLIRLIITKVQRS